MTIQRLMDVVLQAHRPYGTAYLNDMIIHSTSWQDHLHHLRGVLEEFQKAGLMANPWKGHLGLTEAQYLGYSLGCEFLKP